MQFRTGGQPWPLTTGNNDNPTLTQGRPTSFFCNTVPDRCPTGPLAYILPYVVLTIYGTVIQSGTLGSKVYSDDLVRALINSIDWITAWHGTPVSANHVLGSNLPVVEYVAGGYRYALRRRPVTSATAATYPFQISVAIPASSSRLGRLMWDTSQLAALFQSSQLKINVADATVLAGMSTGATFGTLTARCSAQLFPTSELVLGTPVENILHQTVAGTNSPQVQIKGFGTDTMLNGVQSKGGVMFLGELTNVAGQGGAFAAEKITQFSFPWRGQQQIQHMEALVHGMLTAFPNDRPQNLPITPSGGDSEFANPPYTQNNDDTSTTSTTTPLDETNLRWFPLGVNPDSDLQLTDLQTAENDQSYFLTSSNGFSGTHLILAQYARAFSESMRADWVKQVTKGGASSLAAYVLGPNYTKANIGQRLPAGRHVITNDQLTYCPWQLA